MEFKFDADGYIKWRRRFLEGEIKRDKQTLEYFKKCAGEYKYLDLSIGKLEGLIGAHEAELEALNTLEVKE